MKKFLSLIMLCATINPLIASRQVVSQGKVPLNKNVTASWQVSVPAPQSPHLSASQLAVKSLQDQQAGKKKHKNPASKAAKTLVKPYKKLVKKIKFW